MTDIMAEAVEAIEKKLEGSVFDGSAKFAICLLYTSPSPRD